MNEALTISEYAQVCGVSAHTIRFYESEGILSPTLRLKNGHRRFQKQDIAWMAFVMRLKATGMPLAEIKRYASLRNEGDFTLVDRLEMLRLHRKRLACKMQELQINAGALDEKIEAYQKMMGNCKRRT